MLGNTYSVRKDTRNPCLPSLCPNPIPQGPPLLIVWYEFLPGRRGYRIAGPCAKLNCGALCSKKMKNFRMMTAEHYTKWSTEPFCTRGCVPLTAWVSHPWSQLCFLLCFLNTLLRRCRPLDIYKKAIYCTCYSATCFSHSWRITSHPTYQLLC